MRTPLEPDAPEVVRAERQWLRSANREVVRPNEGHGFRWAQHGFPDQGVAKWSYHPEYELHHIRHSEGRYVIGDKVGLFTPGSVWLVGPNLPHDWVSFIHKGEHLASRDTIIQFSDEWISACAEIMPEFHRIIPRLDESRQGLLFRGATARDLGRTMDRMGDLTGLARLASMLVLFETIVSAPEDEVVCLEASYVRPDEPSRKAFSAVDIGLDYILHNLGGEVRLEAAAALAKMAESAFSRYFKRASGLTFTEMTTKLRISQACRLLDVSDESIASIAQTVGYANLSNFNRRFKRATGVTPREYRKGLRARPALQHPLHI